MFQKTFIMFVMLVGVVLCWPTLCLAEEHDPQSNEETWGSIKARYRDKVMIQTMSSGETATDALDKLQKAKSEEEALEILESLPEKIRRQIIDEMEGDIPDVTPSDPPWSHPVAQEIMNVFGLSQFDILAVQRVVMLDNGTPVDSAEVVVTEDRWYYKSLIDESFSTSPSSLTRTTEMDIYGNNVEMLTWHKYCWSIEWGITFYLPACFHEISIGRFDGILDAWAPRPNCSPWCNGGLCALYMCGDTWNGAGYLDWWNYDTCDTDWSKKVAKIVQKRWLHTWQLCHGRSNRQIARSVRARIRF